MVRKVIAASYVALWLFLLGVEFTEDLGFISYDDPSMDSAVEAAIASLGEAIKMSDDALQSSPLLQVSFLPSVVSPLLTHSSFFEAPRELTGPLIKSPIYKLHSVFLI